VGRTTLADSDADWRQQSHFKELDRVIERDMELRKDHARQLEEQNELIRRENDELARNMPSFQDLGFGLRAGSDAALEALGFGRSPEARLMGSASRLDFAFTRGRGFAAGATAGFSDPMSRVANTQAQQLKEQQTSNRLLNEQISLLRAVAQNVGVTN
jgi:hypothetical protein